MAGFFLIPQLMGNTFRFLHYPQKSFEITGHFGFLAQHRLIKIKRITWSKLWRWHGRRKIWELRRLSSILTRRTTREQPTTLKPAFARSFAALLRRRFSLGASPLASGDDGDREGRCVRVVHARQCIDWGCSAGAARLVLWLGRKSATTTARCLLSRTGKVFVFEMHCPAVAFLRPTGTTDAMGCKGTWQVARKKPATLKGLHRIQQLLQEPFVEEDVVLSGRYGHAAALP